VLLKRLFDIFASSLLLIVLSPVMLLIALLVSMRMGRPVVFKQTRPGLNEKPFTLYKFRTMRSGDESDADRLTPFGRFLRAASLDELLELWNVLRGDMSLVGPRPLVMNYLPFFTEHERLRHSVRPGITGWAQIRGRNHLSWDNRLEDDVWYVEHQTFWLDIKILVGTLLVVFQKSGVEVDARSAMLDLDVERKDSINQGLPSVG